MPSVLLIDDHTLFRTSLSLVIEALLPEWAVREAGSLTEALANCQANGAPDLAVLDLQLPDTQGASGVYAWRQTMPTTPVLVLSGSDDPQAIEAALHAGAVAFLSKSASPDQMSAALQAALLAPPVPDPAPTPLSESHTATGECPLSPRQLQVLRCIAQGLTSKAAAEQLGMSEHTVRQHTAEAFRRLGVNNRAQAVLAARPFLG